MSDPRETHLRVWHIDLTAATPALLAIEETTLRLSQDDHERARRFSDATVARSWMAAHVALRLALERVLGPGVRGAAFTRSARGKPALRDAPISFSLSHGAGQALIATGPVGPLGVDIEGVRRLRLTGDRREAIVAGGRALSARDLPRDSTGAFLQAWVRLEALAKAEGRGLAGVLSDTGAYGPRRGQGVAADLLPSGIAVDDLPIGAGFYAAIASASGEPQPSVRRMPDDADGLGRFADGSLP